MTQKLNSTLVRMCCGLAGLSGLLGAASHADAAALTPGNLVVVRMGDGAATLGSTATATFLDEYTTAGVLVQTIPMPTAPLGANKILTNSGSATSEGFLNLSTNGQYLVLGGYNATLGTTGVAATASATVNRVIGRVDLAGNIDTTTSLSDAYNTGNIRSVASSDGLNFWTAGTGGSSTSPGVHYAALGASTSTQLSTTVTNTRVVGINGGQLYTTSASGAFQGVSAVGSGLPTTSGQTITLLPGFPTASGPQSYDFFFADANTLYVADERSTTVGGVQKWTLNAGTWTLAYNGFPLTGSGCRGLTGTVSAGVVTLYVTTTAGAANQLVKAVDTGSGFTFTSLATTAANTAMRGVRYLPITCVGATVATQPVDDFACVGESASFSVVASGTATISYQWNQNGNPLTNGGAVSGADGPTLTINPVAAGDFTTYTVTVSNACGNQTSTQVSLLLDPTDTDNDGTPDCTDGCPNDPNKVAPGACGCGVPDTDTDKDGTPDCLDGCPNDPDKVLPGICGCGIPDADSDKDGTPDCLDGCPRDPLKTNPGTCGCGIPDTDTDGDGQPDCIDRCPGIPNDLDTDGDGTPDCTDGCPNDPNKTAPGQCGCGAPDTDSDSDGTADCNDGCPNDPLKITPGICGCGFVDTDTDSDGTADCLDGCPTDPNKTAPGQCGCGNPDTDTDADGTADCIDGCPADPLKIAPGICGCGVADTDSDSDGTADCLDGCPNDPNKIAPGVCGCGVADTDSDGDGVPDCLDTCPGYPDNVDCNGNSVPDGCDILNQTSADTNNNGIPDECENLCPADVNDSGTVNIDDLLAVINTWGACIDPQNCPTDIAPPPSGNDVVNIDDLLAVINAWGPCP